VFADDTALIDESVTQHKQLTDSVESVAREAGLVTQYTHKCRQNKVCGIGKADELYK